MAIDGNIKAQLQVKVGNTENAIGEKILAWQTVAELFGWLDMSSGDSKYTTYDAKIQESTHVFVCDYKPIPDTLEVEGKTVHVDAENSRLVANSKLYDVMLIDNPMGMNKHLEIYLKYTGGQ